MPFPDFKKVLEEVASHYDPRRITIVVTGGELAIVPAVNTSATASETECTFAMMMVI